MNGLQHSMDRIWSAWAGLDEADRTFILAILELIADRFARADSEAR